MLGLDGVRWMGRYRPSYKVFRAFAPALSGGDLRQLLDANGMLRLRVALHRGEDVDLFESLCRTALPRLEITAAIAPRHPGARSLSPCLAVRCETPDALATIRVLASFESVFVIEPWAGAEPLLDESVWYTQTALPPTAATDVYDTDAKLFVNGLTGRGQVYAAADTGLENDHCHLRYGPNISDTTQPVPATLQPPNVVAPGDPNHRAANKVIAYYLINAGTCQAIPFDEGYPHGTATTACAVGDDYFVSAARNGIDLDDPRDDEEERIASQLYAQLIDHHQQADGMAPGAQVVFQDLSFGPDACLYPLYNLAQQAYDTSPGARVYNNSWGTLPTAPPGYDTENVTQDLQSWRLRDLLIVWAAGNEGPDALTLRTQAGFKDGLTVAMTQRGNVGPGGVANSIAAASSHGPAWPDRIKPDLAAPGELIEAPKPATASPETGIGDGDNACGEFGPFEGTSFAAPTVAGLALDVRQYFTDGYYPGGAPGSSAGFLPTNALLKAILINSTRNLAGNFTADDGTTPNMPRPTAGQGWGHPVVDDTLFFAGDPTLGAEGERSFLLVLTDTPNGVTGATNDSRDQVLEAPQIALRDKQVHSFQLCVDDGEDLHVTLAWSDVPGLPSDASNPAPVLFNDLDLEMIDPLGQVWRPNPRTAVWLAGASVLASGPDRSNANWAPGSGDSSVSDEDFADADRQNPLENVFIRAGNTDFVSGVWTINVIGYNIPGNGLGATLASPNFVNTDGDTQFDTILDTDQGYALVVSGKVATSRGLVHFDKSVYTCGDMASVRLNDCDGDLTSPLEVTVTTSLGDCDRFVLTGTPPFLTTAPFPILDAEAGAAPGTCDLGGDGIVVVGDDGWVRATYADTSPTARQSQAAARMRCRDVRFAGVAVADTCEAGSTGALRRNEPVTLLVTLENASGIAVDNLWGRLVPFDDDVAVQDGGTVIGGIAAGPGGPTVVPFPILVGAAQECPGDLRFRLELYGTQGLRDRVYFDVPLADCSGGGMGGGLRPEEVPARDTPGVRQAVRVAKTGSGQVHLQLTWDRAAGAERYDIWRGLINALCTSGYTHAIPLGTAALRCNIPESDPMDDPAILNQRVLLGEAVNVDPDPPEKANYYYLITAKATCPSGLMSLEGPIGAANRDRDFVPDLDELRPAGLLLDPSCTP